MHGDRKSNVGAGQRRVREVVCECYRSGQLWEPWYYSQKYTYDRSLTQTRSDDPPLIPHRLYAIGWLYPAQRIQIMAARDWSKYGIRLGRAKV